MHFSGARLKGGHIHKKPDVIVSLESGSGIDACKASAMLATFGDIEAELDPYFGVGEVTKLCERTGRIGNRFGRLCHHGRRNQWAAS